MNPMSFTTSTASLKSGDGVPDQFPAGLRVLVVDDDPICLNILEKMLRNCLYEVTKCSRAELALKLLRDNKDGFDVVISDVHMPDMDGFKLLEHVGLEMDLPVIMMSADDSKNVVMKGVTHGACDYLIKPVRMEALKNIWQHVVRKRKHEWREKDFENSGSLDEGGRQKRPAEDIDCSSSANEGTSKSSRKRRDEEDEVEDREDDSSTLKKPRVVWSVELHQQFVTAVNQLGIDKAVPKKILELMNVPGLTRENVASHLQKYRLYLRRLSGSHQNGLGNSFLGPTDTTFGPMATLNGLDLQALASSGQIPPQSLATIQAAALARATNKATTISMPLVDQRNIFSFESPRIRFMDGQQQQQQQLNNSSKQVNLLHGIPTNMDSKQLAALHQSSQSFAGMNMHVHSQSSQSSSLLTQMVQPQSRTQIINEVGSSHSVNHSPSVGQPVLSQALPNNVLARNGIGNVRAPSYTPVSLSPNLGFSMNQRPEFPGNNFPLASNSALASSKGMLQQGFTSEIKGPRSSVSNYDVFNELNPKRVDDWSFESTGVDFDSSRPLNMPSRLDVVPSVLVQPGFSSDPKNDNIGNSTIRPQQLNSNQLDYSLRIKTEKLPDMGFQNNLLLDQFDQDLISAYLKHQQQEGTLPVENDFSFDGYHLDNLPV